MADKLFIRPDESGEIVSWGAELPDAIEIAPANIPSDFYKYSSAKYRWSGTALVARAGWVAPVVDETISTPVKTAENYPETPADPE
jgi:hypothetical protein